VINRRVDGPRGRPTCARARARRHGGQMAARWPGRLGRVVLPLRGRHRTTWSTPPENRQGSKGGGESSRCGHRRAGARLPGRYRKRPARAGNHRACQVSDDKHHNAPEQRRRTRLAAACVSADLPALASRYRSAASGGTPIIQPMSVTGRDMVRGWSSSP